jgi:hypothetical protein
VVPDGDGVVGIVVGAGGLALLLPDAASLQLAADETTATISTPRSALASARAAERER